MLSPEFPGVPQGTPEIPETPGLEITPGAPVGTPLGPHGAPLGPNGPHRGPRVKINEKTHEEHRERAVASERAQSS